MAKIRCCNTNFRIKIGKRPLALQLISATRSEAGACLVVCLKYQRFQPERANKLRALKKKMCMEKRPFVSIIGNALNIISHFSGKPLRVLFLSGDSWVRLVNPTSGTVLTTSLAAAPELLNHKLTDTAYAIYEGGC